MYLVINHVSRFESKVGSFTINGGGGIYFLFDSMILHLWVE